MKSASGDKPKSESKSSVNWLQWTIICLSIGSIIAFRMLFIIDKDLEIKTKIGGNSWQLNSQSIRATVTDIQKFTTQHINPHLQSLSQKSQQLFSQTGSAISARRDWCISKSQISTALDKVKNLNPLEADRQIQSKDTYAKPPQKTSQTNQQKPQVDSANDNLCVTTGVAK
ncbi:hypothetical protein [Chamaesiphon sp. VAR_48_metabat_403]|uniref:hypothetical protein n=1 Tax=Chamaesiphon sp. VAR_48_metabat_403 TaxID=2964700 RepID=UPI00286DF8D2|nr:hypothetical protein [Chamaesiphon sp. VAR_48_metabat_403]